MSINSPDGGSFMYPLCDATKPTYPCTGVVGAATPYQVPHTLSNKFNYETLLRNTDECTTFSGADLLQCKCSKLDNSGKNTLLGFYDRSGWCIKDSIGENINIQQNSRICISGSQQDSYYYNTYNEKYPSFDMYNGITDKSSLEDISKIFPIQSMHKVWGSGGSTNPNNRGVNSRNVFVKNSQENIVTKYPKQTTIKQNVLYLNANGDNYTGDVAGLTNNGKETPMCYNTNKTFSISTGTKEDKFKCVDGITMPSCPEWTELEENDDPNWNKRVGGCAVTKDLFGPGVYNILAYVPTTGSKKLGGRGYCWAIWPFHNEEIYNENTDGQPVTDLNKTQYRDNIKFPCFNGCDDVEANPPICPSLGGDGKKDDACKGTPDDHGSTDLFSVINHEIDIEVPANSPQFSDKWDTMLTWNTMNVTPWQQDMQNYDEFTGAYYSQINGKNSKRDFISSEHESSQTKDYHWYTIEWYVDPSTDITTSVQNSYIAIYFDDPFDPSGQTKFNGNVLPLKPSGDTTNTSERGLVAKTSRFVPTRAGRLNFGPWFSWWGFNNNAKLPGKPDFDTISCRVAHLSIIPMANYTNGKNVGYSFPQNYDQQNSAGEGTNCDFMPLNYLVTKGTPLPKNPLKPDPQTPSSNQKSSSNSNTLLIIGIVVAILFVIGFLIFLIYFLKKKMKK